MSNRIDPLNEDLAVHQKMEDEPNDVGGLSAEELKAKYDYAALAIQKYLNEAMVKAVNALGLELDGLAKQLNDHVDIDPGNLTAQNIGILRELADKYGLTDKLAPTVHDALEVLEQAVKCLDHWWVRRPGLSEVSDVWLGDAVVVPSLSTTAGRRYAFACSVYDKGYPDVTVTYAEDVINDESGVLYLKDPKSITTSPRTFEANVPIELLRGKYVQAWDDPTHIMRVCEDASLVSTGGSTATTFATYYFSASKVQEVFCSVGDRGWERVHSADRNAYPDEGEQDGMEYRYLGVPVERLIDKMVEEATAE